MEDNIDCPQIGKRWENDELVYKPVTADVADALKDPSGYSIDVALRWKSFVGYYYTQDKTIRSIAMGYWTGEFMRDNAMRPGDTVIRPSHVVFEIEKEV